MLPKIDMWLLEEPIEDPTDLLTIPEIKREVVGPPHDEDGIGLRLLLERPEVLARSLWQAA
jgi:hypothetical protein